MDCDEPIRPGFEIPTSPSPVTALLVALGLTVAVTVVFRVSDLDLRLQALAFSPTEPHWPHAGAAAWVLVYHLGTLPGLALCLLAAVGLGLSFIRADFLRWRYPCLFLVLLFALGPGLLINLVAKGFGGRPRPDQILEFGGLLGFRRPFDPGLPHKGYSFMCGHCSMGFMFMALFFLLRGRRRWACLAFGALFGLAQGAGRMVQGAHFASDAILGGTTIFALGAVLSPVASWRPGGLLERRHRWRAAGATAFLLALMMCGFLLSMPIREERTDLWFEPAAAPPSAEVTLWPWRAGPDRAPPALVDVRVAVGDIALELATTEEPLRIGSRVTGFGFPGAASRVRVTRAVQERRLRYVQALGGFWMERQGRLQVRLADDQETVVSLATPRGEVLLVGPLGGREVLLSGTFTLRDPRAEFEPAGPGAYRRAGNGPPVRIEIHASLVVVQP